jgi:hypothetical protein
MGVRRVTSPTLGDRDWTLNLALLMLITAISIVIVVGAVLALLSGALWPPAAISVLITTSLGAAIALFRILTARGSGSDS